MEESTDLEGWKRALIWRNACMDSYWDMILAVTIQTVQRDFPVFISGQLRLLERLLLCHFIPRDSLNTLWITHSMLIRSEGKHKNQSSDFNPGTLQIPCGPGVQLPAAPSCPCSRGGCQAAPRDALSACASSGGKNTAGEAREGTPEWI